MLQDTNYILSQNH